MRVIYLVAGAGDMYCGSCMRDNRLAARLIAGGRDVVLMPLYTPIRTDEQDVSDRRVWYGGINVFLQQRWSLFRRTPWLVDRLLDRPWLLRSLGKLASSTRADQLGELTLSVLRGQEGRQRKEMVRLIRHLKELKPSLVHLPNLMFAGIAQPMRDALNVPIVCSLAGEDIFLDALPEPQRSDCFTCIRRLAGGIDAFIAPTVYYGEHAARHFQLPAERIRFASMGINVAHFSGIAAPPDEPFTIGYFARICREKGLHLLAEAFATLRRSGRNCRLRIAGYLGRADRQYVEEVSRSLQQAGCDGHVDLVGELDRAEKLAFLKSLHVLSVPTTYAEAKGFFVLEALAAGVPVVQPRHGSFPELIEATNGGILYDNTGPQPLADGLAFMMDHPEQRALYAREGRAAVHACFTDEVMAEQTWEVYEEVLQGPVSIAQRPVAAAGPVSA